MTALTPITGYGQQQDRAMSHAAGFHHHLVKPADTRKLIQIIESS